MESAAAENSEDYVESCKQCSPKPSSNIWECCLFGENENRLLKGPPFYSQLGQEAREVFTQGYNIGIIKVAFGIHPSDSSSFVLESQLGARKLTGFLESRYVNKEYGLVFSEKLTDSQELQSKVSWQDKLLEGLKMEMVCNFMVPTGDPSGTINVTYQNKYAALSTEIDIDKEATTVFGTSAVLDYKGWFLGLQGAYDIRNNKFPKTNCALGFSTEDIILATFCNTTEEGQEYGGTLYKKFEPLMDVGVSAAWSSGGEKTRLGIAARYYLENGAVLRGKINNASQIALGYSQKLREGVTLNLSALFDAKDAAGHKVGLGFCVQV